MAMTMAMTNPTSSSLALQKDTLNSRYCCCCCCCLAAVGCCDLLSNGPQHNNIRWTDQAVVLQLSDIPSDVAKSGKLFELMRKYQWMEKKSVEAGNKGDQAEAKCALCDRVPQVSCRQMT